MKVASISCLVLSFVFCLFSTPSAKCQGLDHLLEPGAQLVLPLDPSASLPTICETLRCPEPPFGGELDEGVDTGLSVFLSFWKLQLLHPRGKFYFLLSGKGFRACYVVKIRAQRALSITEGFDHKAPSAFRKRVKTGENTVSN